MSGDEHLRQLPAVHDVLERLGDAAAAYPRPLVVEEVRRAIAAERARLERSPGAEPGIIEDAVLAELAALERPSLRPVINASGVILHTNLGRAPLGRFQPHPGYTNLEYDLAAGKRGKRDVHASALLERLLGQPGIAVNNNAAAVYLVLNELAAGGEVIVSRGELIEIGDGFRIPDIMARSGALLREVGTTNKTNIEDYRQAFTERTRLILTVHRSNFHITGFTAKPGLKGLAALAREMAVPLYEDLGSGCIADLRAHGVNEPLPAESLRNGVDIVSFSGDKLLGGPQAGIIAGRRELVTRVRRNPMFRALRVDKLVYQALGETLRNLLLERYDRIPALRMIAQPAEEIRRRAEAFLAAAPEIDAEVRPGESVIGGGSTPDQSLPTWLIAITGRDAAKLERSLRAGDPPVIARIEDSVLLLDLRTVFPDQEPALRAALARG